MKQESRDSGITFPGDTQNSGEHVPENTLRLGLRWKLALLRPPEVLSNLNYYTGI